MTTTTNANCGPCHAGSIAAFYDAWIIPPEWDADLRFELTKSRARDSFCEEHAREFFTRLGEGEA
jgi:hypothetical protein